MTAPHRDEVVKLEASLQGLLAGPSTLSFLVELAARWGEPLYLVGGFLRDALLGQSSDDLRRRCPTDQVLPECSARAKYSPIHEGVSGPERQRENRESDNQPYR